MDELTNLFLKYIEQRAANKTTGIQKPFFAVLSVPPPNPYIAPSEYIAH